MTVMIAQVIFLVVSIALVAMILLQQSKGAGMGASFGGGASGTVFGAKGAGSFLYKTTRLLAIVFFVSALGLGYMQNKSLKSSSILQETNLEQQNVEPTVAIPTAKEGTAVETSQTGIPNPAPATTE